MQTKSENPIRVLILSKFLDQVVLRQTPGSNGYWGNCHFTINASGGSFDRVAIFDNCATSVDVTCPADGTLMLTGEPPEVKTYHKEFLAQFARVVAQDSNTPHPHFIEYQSGQPWFVGIASEIGMPPRVNLSYEQLAAAKPKKTKLLSIMVGRTTLTEAHKNRPKIANVLERRFGDDIVVFGHEINRVNDKWDALAPFKYHIALENSRYPHYWTEKLSDPYLADCFPFYWGCPNTNDYFDPGGHHWINIYDPEGTADVISRAIDDGLYEKTREIRQRNKERILTKYNLFALLDKLLSTPTSEPAQQMTIHPEHHFADSEFRKFRHRLKRVVPRRLRPKRWKA